MTPSAFVDLFKSLKASAILRTDVEENAGPAMDAAVRGGIRICEFTMTTPGVLERIAEFSRRDGLVVGAGTIGILRACCIDGMLSRDEADDILGAMLDAGYYAPVQRISDLL